MGHVDKPIMWASPVRKVSVAFVAGALSCLAFVLAVGAPKPSTEVDDTIAAKEFLLLDDNGKRRARLSMIPSGPELTFFDASGKQRVAIGIRGGIDEMPALLLWDTTQELRTVIGAIRLPRGGPHTVDKRPESSILLLDEDGNTRSLSDDE